ncbi:MAG: ferredoxin [Desulfitibacter sp. BRH_c19]|nr:MAG: ferredoxin [Desulfitibacter sp. BRH_c19]
MSLQYIKNVSTLKFDPKLCNGCGMCLNVCPHNVLSIVDKKINIKHKDSCMECSACVKNCPQEALSVNPGVGCAYAILIGMIKGTAPNCDC